MIENVRIGKRMRTSEMLLILDEIGQLEQLNGLLPTTIFIRTKRGLIYVQLYAIIEWVSNELAKEYIEFAKTLNVKNNHYKKPFLAIALFSKIDSLRKVEIRKIFPESISLFSQINDIDVVDLNEGELSKFLESAGPDRLRTMMELFCINFELEPRINTLLKEVLEKRGNVAHGRETASMVGSSFNSIELRNKFNEIDQFLDRMIDTIADAMSQKSFIADSYTQIY